MVFRRKHWMKWVVRVEEMCDVDGDGNIIVLSKIDVIQQNII
jgi:hypothetical protein